ncbi:hypothetical protein UT300016_06240 [Clostridium senegalense]
MIKLNGSLRAKAKYVVVFDVSSRYRGRILYVSESRVAFKAKIRWYRVIDAL